MIKIRDKRAFYCFSPPVMLATFVIEICYILYILFRYKLDKLGRLVVAILFFLATFQLAEYFVCGGLGTSAATWSKVGFASITILPPLGIHLIYTMIGRKWNNVIGAAYAMAAAWIIIFLFGSRVFESHVCAGNYAIFQIKPGLGGLYFAYYYFWLFVGLLLSLSYGRSQNKKHTKTKQALILFMIAYLMLLIPTTLANLVKPETIEGIPSIMCGFAIILATIITFGVIPRLGKLKKK